MEKTFETVSIRNHTFLLNDYQVDTLLDIIREFERSKENATTNKNARINGNH